MFKDFHGIRNVQAGSLLESVLVSAVVTILITRFILFITGYPVLGGGNFHIAHMLWGGFLMLVALTLLLAFLSHRVKILSAIIGGIGFGLFIDELGKFITRDNNYFFQPTIALLYVIFLSLFFLFRYIDRAQPLSQKEYLMNALFLLEEAVLHDMDETEKNKYLQFLKQSGSYHYLKPDLERLSKKINLSVPKLNKLQKFIQATTDKIDSFLISPFYQTLIVFIFVLQAVISAVTILFVIMFQLEHSQTLLIPVWQPSLFTTWGEVYSTLISTAFAVVGVIILRRSKQKAFRFFKTSVLVTILITMFFKFYYAQFGAVSGLLINLVLLIGLNNMIVFEKNKPAHNKKGSNSF